MNTFDDTPKEEISISSLVEELRKREETNRANEQERNRVASLREDVGAQQAEVAATGIYINQLEEKLAEQRDKLFQQNEALEKLISDGKAAAKKADALTEADTDSIKQQIESASSTNDKIRANMAARNMKKEIAGCEKRLKGIADKLDGLIAEKKDLISNAKFAIPGLALSEDDITVDGIRFENLASGDQTEISVAMALAMQPELHVVLIHGGSLLDEKHLKNIARMAKESNTTILMEVVGSGPEIDIFLEDGQIAEKPVKEYPDWDAGRLKETEEEYNGQSQLL